MGRLETLRKGTLEQRFKGERGVTTCRSRSSVNEVVTGPACVCTGPAGTASSFQPPCPPRSSLPTRLSSPHASAHTCDAPSLKSCFFSQLLTLYSICPCRRSPVVSAESAHCGNLLTLFCALQTYIWVATLPINNLCHLGQVCPSVKWK